MQDLRLPRKEPPAESFARFMGNVIRIPTAAKPPKHPNLPSLEGKSKRTGFVVSVASENPVRHFHREGDRGDRLRCAANCIRREPQATENAVSRFPLGWRGADGNFPCDFIPTHAGPWRRPAAKPQDGCGAAAGYRNVRRPIIFTRRTFIPHS